MWGSFLDRPCPQHQHVEAFAGCGRTVRGDLPPPLWPLCAWPRAERVTSAHAVSGFLPVTVAGQVVEGLGGPHGRTLGVLAQAAERAPEGRGPAENQRAIFRARGEGN